MTAVQSAGIKKRIVVCCDGTWQDGLVVNQRWKYTNILRLARVVNHSDERLNPHIPQVVFYQSGVGTWGDRYIEALDGIVGASLADKVQEAYAFIAHNFRPGDELFLFGFSRGAYTARMVAELIGGIGVLDRTDMDHFADIFTAYQKRGKAEDPGEIAALDKQLFPWTQHTSPGKRRADSDKDTFSIKCVGVFDTVGSLGLPEELTLSSPKMKTLFGFPDRHLGEHIQFAFQALALDEHRKDFNCAKFEQTEGGRRKGQVLRQCWFSGSHSDIGGGFEDHDLSDISLTWMCANICDVLSLDYKYLASLPDPVASWGELAPHNSSTGVFALAETIQRAVPTSTDDVTHETIHPSVLHQKKVHPDVSHAVQANPSILWTLLPYEEHVKADWRVQRAPSIAVAKEDHDVLGRVLQAANEATKDGRHVGQAIVHALGHKHDDNSRAVDPMTRIVHESSMGSLLKEFVADHS